MATLTRIITTALEKIANKQSNLDADPSGTKYPNVTAVKGGLDGKVDKVTGKSLIDNTEISRLASMTAIFTSVLKTAYDSTVTWISTNGASLLAHLGDTSNPHNVTKSQVGLSNVDNTSDANKAISTATWAALGGKLNNTNDTFTGVFDLNGTIDQDTTVTDISIVRPVVNSTLIEVKPSGTLPSLTDYHGNDNVMRYTGIDSGGFASIYGLEYTVHNDSAFATSRMVAFYGLSENKGAGNTTDLVAYQAWTRNSGSGTVQNAQGLRIYNPQNSGGGVISNAYGIYIDNFTTGTVRNYGIYSLAKNYFQSIEVGSTTVVANLNASTCEGFRGSFMPCGEDTRASSNAANANNITKSGFYSLTNSATNTPIASQFWNIMHTAMKGTLNYHVQVAINVETGRMFTRNQNNGTWAAWVETQRAINGSTGSRPSGVSLGIQYFDTTLNKPIWWNGSVWKDATGTTV